MDLCTVVSENYINQAINLIQSYKVLSYNKQIFVYYFNSSKEKLNIFTHLFGDQVKLIEVPKVCDHALDPRVFFYKAFSIRDCLLNHSDSMIYSDSANCFVREAKNIGNDLVDDSLFLAYSHPKLTNQYWTTKECFKTMQCISAEIMPQYWAGFQVYNKSAQNLKFVNGMYEHMLNPCAALPDTTVKHPDGKESPCIEHRQDQSVLSLLIHNHNRHQFFDIGKNNKYGDWQTIVNFDSTYKHDFNKMILSPRESKFGSFRFLNV